MKRFIVENSFWSLFPEAKIGVIACANINNKAILDFQNDMRRAEEKSTQYFPNSEFSKNDVIQVWRDAFMRFKTKKGARSSIEALMKRIQKGGQLKSINPLVDIYNSISLSYALPCGGEDLDKIQGDLKLTYAIGNESFLPLGESESSSPYPDEIVYKDSVGAVCRCLNWREAVRTMLTEETTHAFMCIESLDVSRESDFNEALLSLEKLIEEHLGGDLTVSIIDKNNPSVLIDDRG